jgi:dipeptidyl aminopeptidase/acylaminoacyl peptidase
MRSRFRGLHRIVVPVLAGIVAAPWVHAAAAESGELPAVADFFRNADISDEKLSPSGKYLALLGHDALGRVRLVTTDTAHPTALRIAAGFSNADIYSFRWVDDDRLVFSLVDWTGEQSTGNGGLFAVDRDGSNSVPLIAPSFLFHQDVTGTLIHSRELPATYTLFSETHDGSGDVIVAENLFHNTDRSPRAVVLHRLNTRTREKKNLTMGQPPGVLSWILDPNGLPRIATAFVEGRRIVYQRDRESQEWTLQGNFDQNSASDFKPMFIGIDGALYVQKDSAGALFRFDLAQHRFDDEPMLKLVGYDLLIRPEIDAKARKVLGYHYLTDAPGTAWIDPRFAEYQKEIDAALPGTVNTISCGACSTSKFLLIKSASDRQPAAYYLFNVEDKSLVGTSGERPWIKPSQMGRREFVHYRARDGMSIPAYVTRPPAQYKGPFPLVVLVHGGPWVRGGSWEWDAEAQFLASRGYAVVQPEFRGSTGFGFEHFKAGWKQWGLAMQDDLADAAQWAVAQGIVDPKRIAIAGASYGGYAALMGLVKNPEIFRCAVEWVGVTDLNLLYTVSWSDTSDEYLQYGAPVLIGDSKKDAEQLKATSPLVNAKRITQPVLMAYGTLDRRVPLVHGEELRSAIATPPKDVEWIAYPEEGHGWFKETDRIDFWTRVEKFLDRYLKSPPASPGEPGSQ